MAGSFYSILLAILLVLVNGFFVAAEFALVRLRHAQAVALARTHGLAGRLLPGVRARLDTYLSACRLGITLATLCLGWIGAPLVARLISPLLQTSGTGMLHGLGFAVALALISFVHIVAGELAPKSISIRHAQAVLLWTVLPLYAFHWIVYPFIRLLTGSAGLLLRLVGVRAAGENRDAQRLSEMKQVLLASHRHGELGRFSAGLLTRARSLEELTAGDVMRPGAVALDAAAGLGETLAVIDAGFSRFPVYEGDPGNVIGIVEVKDLFAAVRRGDSLTDLRPLVRRTLFIDRRTPAARVLDKFRSGAPPLALVVDEHGAVKGCVTLDDIAEAAIGSPRDEPVSENPGWSKLNDGNYAGQGSLPLYSLERLLGVEIAADDVNSIGGLIMSRLDRIPRAGDNVPFGLFDVEVLEMQGAQVTQVLVRRSGRERADPGRLM